MEGVLCVVCRVWSVESVLYGGCGVWKVCCVECAVSRVCCVEGVEGMEGMLCGGCGV